MATYAVYFNASTVAQRHHILQLRALEPTPTISEPEVHEDQVVSSTRARSTRAHSTIIDPQNYSPLFRLPAELRNQIYTDLLCPDAVPLKALARRDRDLSVRHFNQTSTSTKLYPSILSTCRRIANEATEMLYAPHTFHAHPSLLTALPHLTSASRPVLYPHFGRSITRWQICLRLDTDPRFNADQATAAFSGAECFEVRVWQAQFEASDYEVLKLFTGVRNVGIARVGGSVDAEVARWLEDLMMTPSSKPDGELCSCEAGSRDMVCGACHKAVGEAKLGRKRDLWIFGGR